MIRFECNQCGKTISAADEHAGRKCKCPACQQVLAIPSQPPSLEPADPEPLPTKMKPDARIASGKQSPAPLRHAVQEDRDPPARSRPGGAPTRSRARDDEDDDDDHDDGPPRRGKRRRSRRRGPYADCPSCGAAGYATRVGFTFWGGFIGPWLLTHVRCDECGTCYNGRSGKDNTVGILLYVFVPLVIGIGFFVLCGVLGALADA